jgi:Na+/proline symporter
MDSQLVAAFIIYFSAILLIGLVAHRKNTSASDFMVGGRSVNFWVTALSAHASDMSSWLFMGFPVAIYGFGLSRASIAIGLVVGMFLNWHFVAPKLRVATEKYNSYTLSDYLENRFHDHSGLLRLLTATMLLIFLTTYIAAGLTSIGLLSESVLNVNYHTAIIVATAIMVAYTLYGGFVSIAWVDFYQALFLLGVIVVCCAKQSRRTQRHNRCRCCP